MTREQAVDWLRQVRGQVFRSRRSNGSEAWVAVVHSPRPGPKRPRLIVALGESPYEATTVAEAQWQALWSEAGPFH